MMLELTELPNGGQQLGKRGHDVAMRLVFHTFLNTFLKTIVMDLDVEIRPLRRNWKDRSPGWVG